MLQAWCIKDHQYQNRNTTKIINYTQKTIWLQKPSDELKASQKKNKLKKTNQNKNRNPYQNNNNKTHKTKPTPKPSHKQKESWTVILGATLFPVQERSIMVERAT